MVAYPAKLPTRQMGWLRHVLTVLSVIIFLLGCIVLGYMAWVLATAVTYTDELQQPLTVTKFLGGTLIWTYVVITLGFSLFFAGLLGWVGGASESPCLVRLFLVFLVLSMLAELGGIIYLNVISVGFQEVLEHGWREVNQGTRNIVQRHLGCCGWQGKDDFLNNGPIDDSCYERVTPSISGVVARASITLDYSGRVEEKSSAAGTKRMKSEACKDNLYNWFMDNKITWVTILAAVVAIQVMCIGISIYILTRIKKMRNMRSSRTISKRKLYDSSSEGSEPHEKFSHEYRQRI